MYPESMFLTLTLLLATATASPDRIVHAAKLWGEVRYYHPWLFTRDIDWDAAFIRALPRIEGEKDERVGLQALLDELHDPGTAMIADFPPSPKKASTWTWGKNEVLSVKLGQAAGPTELRLELDRLKPEVARAKALVLDARGQPPARAGVEDASDELDELLTSLAPRALRLPALRVVIHSGYSSQLGGGSGGYTSGFLSTIPAEIPAGKPGPKRIALVVDANSPLPLAALALRDAGVARIFAEGPIDDRLVVHPRVLELAPGLSAQIRTGELEVPLAADVTAARDRGVKAALDWIGSAAAPRPRASAPQPRPHPGVGRLDKTYPEMQEPGRAYRLLALVRFWNVIERFYPYKRLLDGPWDSVLRDFIPRFEKAEGADAYARVVLEMAAQIQDSHVGVRGSASVRAITGEAGVGLRVQLLDGVPVVVEIRNPEAAARGVRLGDVIEGIDGEPLLDRTARFEKYAAASLPLGRKSRAISFALAGAKGSTAALKLSDGGPGSRTVQLVRGDYPQPALPSFRLLAGNVGYADLTRLTRAEVDAMFEKLGLTRALVLDMRGYPKGTAWSIAPRLNVKKATRAAWFERNYLSGSLEEGADNAIFRFQQEIPEQGKPDQPLYRGRVIMLIDEFAISQSEHSGLFFEAATDVTYVGSPTAGANGDVTFLSLPGGLYVSFTGHDVRHADGRQLQRIGLQPQVSVRPTAAGIRAGRDEVLERALELLGEPR
jgi:C-terminal processing protease CtpA/Prc